MRCPRLGRLKWLVLTPLVLPLFWGLILAVMPTDWARRRVEAALRDATGQEVRLGAVCLGPTGRLRLRALELVAPDQPDEPWMHVDEVAADLSLLQLLTDCKRVTRVEATGLVLRLRRTPGGSFPFLPLLRTTKQPERSGAQATSPSEVDFLLTGSQILVIDEPTGTRLEMTELEGHGTWEPHHASLEQLTGKLNGGPFELNADLVRTTKGPSFEAEIKARSVAFAERPRLLGFVTPVLGHPESAVGFKGTLDLNLYLRGQGATPDELARSVAGQGAFRLDSIRLEDLSLLSELRKVVEFPTETGVGAARGEFRIASGKVTTDPLLLEIGSVPLVLSGSTDFDGRYDYKVRSEMLAGLLAPDLQALLPDLPVRVEEVLEIRVQGSSASMLVTLNGTPVGTDPEGRPLSSRERWRDAARRLRDRLLR